MAGVIIEWLHRGDARVHCWSGIDRESNEEGCNVEGDEEVEEEQILYFS